MEKRTPYDGHPYYCKICGVGFAEYMACEENDCELESEATAKSRKKRGAAVVMTKRGADLKPGDVVFMHDNSLRKVQKVDYGEGLIPKGLENNERVVLVYWYEGGMSAILRESVCMLNEESNG